MIRSASDLDFVLIEAIEAYAAKLPNFSYSTFIADAASNQPRKGWVTQHTPADALNDCDVGVYLCGAPPMVEAVLKHFDDEGVKPNSFHLCCHGPSMSNSARDITTSRRCCAQSS